MTTDLVSLEDVEAARNRIEAATLRTPLDPSNTLARLSGASRVHLKLENMQRTGSFKARGAYNKLSRLPGGERDAGVVTISSGNHAQGVAYAARELDVDATVVMPTFTPAVKVDATRGYGATVEIYGSTYRELHDRAMALAEERDLTFVHPFDDPDVIAGQGTVGLEIVDACPEVDVVVAAVGGGGLLAGIATAVKGHNDEARIVGVETTGSAHAGRSVERGEIDPREEIDTIAEGIAAGRLGERTMAIIREEVDELVEVDDEAVTRAMTLLAERANTVAEPAGATPAAALLDGGFEGETVALVVSGGNVGVTEFGALTRVGLASLDRYVTVRLALANWPTSLDAVVETVEGHGAELEDVRTEPLGADDPTNRRAVTVAVTGTGREHLHEVVGALADREAVTVVSADLADP